MHRAHQCFRINVVIVVVVVSLSRERLSQTCRLESEARRQTVTILAICREGAEPRSHASGLHQWSSWYHGP